MAGLLKRLSSLFRKEGDFFLEIKNLTGFSPRNISQYELALRHSSASRQDSGSKLNNQRLEYLGDAVLGAVVADFLYQKYPGGGEGLLTSMRSKIVSRKSLNQLGVKMGLNKLVIKRTARTAHAKSIYGDALEALIGALYLDLGYNACQHFITERVILAHVDLDQIKERIASHKGALLEWGQKNRKEVRFEITGCHGESHARRYEIALTVDGETISTGKGTSKKKAEEDAARVAYKKIKPL